jgi:spore coat protein U-like protein
MKRRIIDAMHGASGVTKWVLLAAFAAGLVFAATGSKTANYIVSVVSPLNFGSYDTINPLPGSAVITVTCTRSGGKAEVAPITIALSSGPGSYAARQMNLIAGPDVMLYNLYTNAARTQVWGDGTAGTAVVSDTINLPGPPGNPPQTSTYTIFGLIGGNQNLRAGTYQTLSGIIITLTF